MSGGLLLASAGGLCRAGSVTIGSPNSTNADPFEAVTSGVYQQIYGSQSFGTTPVEITGVTFFGSSNSTITQATYNVNVSTVQAAVGASSLYTLGANNVQEFNSTLGGAIVGGSFTISFSQPFFYNPTAGNLLLQISVTGGPSNPGGSGLYTMSNGGALFSRAVDVFDGPTNIAFTDSTGLVTQFNTATGVAGASAPEPGSFALLGFSLVGVALIVGRAHHRRARMAMRLREELAS
jgi:hypothetical protein